MDFKSVANSKIDTEELDKLSETDFKNDLESDKQDEEVKKELEAEEAEEQNTTSAASAVESKEEEVEEKKEEPDYREKFKQSSKEALRLREENQRLQEEKEALAEKKTVSEEELKATYPDWEDKTQAEQEALRDKENLELRVKALEARNQIYLNEQKFNKQITDQMDIWEATGEYKDIMTHQDEFKKFCRRDGNKGLEPEKLAKLFLYDLPTEEPVRGNTPMARSTGRKENMKTEKTYSSEESSQLRRSNPRKWQQMLMQGKFKN